MRELWKKFYLHFWYRLEMVNAYLAYHRGDMMECAEAENAANRCQAELQRMEIIRRAI